MCAARNNHMFGAVSLPLNQYQSCAVLNRVKLNGKFLIVQQCFIILMVTNFSRPDRPMFLFGRAFKRTFFPSKFLLNNTIFCSKLIVLRRILRPMVQCSGRWLRWPNVRLLEIRSKIWNPNVWIRTFGFQRAFKRDYSWIWDSLWPRLLASRSQCSLLF